MGIFEKIGTAVRAIGAGFQTVGTVLPPAGYDFRTGQVFTHLLSIASEEDSPRKIFIQSPYLQNAWVYSAIQVMATNLAQAPWIIKKGDTVVEESAASNDGWVPRLFSWVSPTENRFSLWEAVIVWLSIRGECFWHLMRAGNGRPARIEILIPDRMGEVIANNELIGWEYKTGDKVYPLDPNDIIQFKYYNPFNKWRGMSPLLASAIGMHIDFAASVYNWNFFNNDATPVGVVSAQETINQGDADSMEKRWQAKFGGPRKKGKVAVLGKGATYTAMGLAQKDIMYIQQKKWSQSEVFAVLNVPPALIQILEFASIKSNIREQRQQLFENNLIPKMLYFEDMLKTQFFDREQIGHLTGEFDRSTISALKETLGEKLEAAKKLFDMSVPFNMLNEKFELGYEDLPWGDQGFLPMTYVPVGAPGGNGKQNPAQGTEPKTMQLVTAEPVVKTRGARVVREGESIYRKIHPFEIQMRTYLESTFQEMRGDCLGRIFKKIKSIDEDVNDLLPDFAEYDEKIMKFILPVYGNVIEVTVDQLRSILRTDTKLSSEAVNRIAAEKQIRIVEINDTIREQIISEIRPIIQDAVRSGASYNSVAEQLANEVRNIFNNVRRRTPTVARTEINGVMSETNWQTMNETGVERHQWVSLRYIRPSHIAIHLKIREIGEEFLPRLKYPYDPDAPPKEVINCGCTVIPLVD
jgi:HK97 family phage portal protein